MIHVISIAPTPGGWRVRVDDADLPGRFASGAEAERAARAEAERLAALGEPAKLHVHLPDGTLAARFVHAVRAAPEASPVLWRNPPARSGALQPA
ncbi:DUF2188 domain-containing protein [Phenylobacterium aquaticum]|uniref:DUF2188 domain-containing protein n=1 Tax=Phenylobacterium aquaticum TaxID=1763816 RepID=UPI001F5D81C8|nr:DUF2188 domain-containing protein [Phenylobacterium aquaticum]